MNEKEIARVPDLPPPAVKKRLNTTEKQPLSSTLKKILAFNPDYQPRRILERGLEIWLAANSDSSPLGLFQLFITEGHLALIAIHINFNTAKKGAQDVHWKNRKLVMTDLRRAKKE